MIDIHSHILPQIDDGSASVKESVKMLQRLEKQGVHTVVATPHFYAFDDRLEDFLDRRDAAYHKVMKAAPWKLNILLGAEVTYFDGMVHCPELEQLQLGNSGLLLVEMPFQKWTDHMVAEICDLPQGVGVTPVLAHVDRYMGIGQIRKYARRLLENGVYFQCNADVFSNKMKRIWIFKQMQQGNIHFFGSDCHNMTTRPPQMDRMAEAVKEKLGPHAMAEINDTAQMLLGIER